MVWHQRKQLLRISSSEMLGGRSRLISEGKLDSIMCPRLGEHQIPGKALQAICENKVIERQMWSKHRRISSTANLQDFNLENIVAASLL